MKQYYKYKQTHQYIYASVTVAPFPSPDKRVCSTGKISLAWHGLSDIDREKPADNAESTSSPICTNIAATAARSIKTSGWSANRNGNRHQTRGFVRFLLNQKSLAKNDIEKNLKYIAYYYRSRIVKFTQYTDMTEELRSLITN